jgi:hypothetical protein
MKLSLVAAVILMFIGSVAAANADCDGGTGTCGGGTCKKSERVCYHKDGSADTCVDDSACH